MLIKSLKKLICFILLPVNSQAIKDKWQNYIDGTVGRPPYYLYQDAMERYLSSSNGSNALVLGCGAGNEEINLIKKGWNITAIDTNKRSNEIIRERIKELPGNFNFQHGDFSSIQMSGKYDLIMSLFALPFGNKIELGSLFKRFNEYTKTGSVLVANFFGKNHSFVKKSLAYSLTEEELFFYSKTIILK